MVKIKEKYDKYWDEILHCEKIISDKEAEEMQNYVKKIRKEKWERNLYN